MSEQHRASEAIYHPIPQAPVASNVVPTASPDLDLDEEVVPAEVPAVLSHNLADTRIRWIHFLLGCAVLLPWNALITATPYFQSRVAGTSLKSVFSSYLSTTFTAANFLFLAHATVTAKKASNTRRVLYSLTALAALCFLLTFSTYTHPAPGGFFAFVLLNAIGQAAAGSYLQTAVVAVASLFGPSAMQALMSGQAAVAVVISGVQVLSALASVGSSKPEMIVASSEPEEQSAFVFFGLSTVFLLVCVGVYTWLVSLPAYKAVTSQRSARRPSTAEGASLLHEENGIDTVHELRKPEQKNYAVRLAKTNGTFNLAVAYVFIVTLAVFPPITISVTSTNPSVHPLVFSAIHFLMFNVGDFTGRTLCSLPSLHVWSARRLLTLSLLRTLFIPLFLMCNIQWSSSQSSSGPIIGSDALFMLLMVAFGLTNGYVSSMCMMAAPSLAHNPRLQGRAEDVDVAATVASFCLVGGLAVGSILSFAVRAAVCDCNPFTE
ncbi:nucleoside transporter-domain-containing protein [Dichomitus squalens]|uniref:Nucleoside transporter-domain-containing protein n=1 Tax=Dichomitus squalens TaxID=114155 RepID=A0A4Q9QAR6_9APHY|nr:nucleoside transporter-domain-containing protein [Dichomitus squalens]TBU64161.1 nucleoside transporter-domain-containing protein [Dichomitus squalens]